MLDAILKTSYSKHVESMSPAAMSKKMAIATAAAKKAGFGSFKKGSAGASKRHQIAIAIEQKMLSKKGK